MVAFDYTQQVLLKSVLFRGSIAESTTELSMYIQHTRCCIWLSYVDNYYIL